MGKAKHTTLGTITKSNIKIVDRGKRRSTYTRIHDCSLFRQIYYIEFTL